MKNHGDQHIQPLNYHCEYDNWLNYGVLVTLDW